CARGVRRGAPGRSGRAHPIEAVDHARAAARRVHRGAVAVRRVGAPLGALILVVAVACQEKLTTPVDCPELCPGQSLIIRDTVLLPLAGLDSSYAGYVSAAAVPALLVSDGLAAGEARAFATFPRQSGSRTVAGPPP